jgi:hypothetical protein
VIQLADKPTVVVVPGSVDEAILRAQYGDKINIQYGNANQFSGRDRIDTNKQYQNYLASQGITPVSSGGDLWSYTGTTPIVNGRAATSLPSAGVTPSGGAATGGLGGTIKSTPANTNPISTTVPTVYSPYTPAPKQNAYYASQVDYENAVKAGLDKYYNLTPWSGQRIGAGEIALGGSGVIPDTAVSQDATRLGGVDRYETAEKINTFVKGLSAISPQQYMQMPPQQLQNAIQQSANALNANVNELKNLITTTLQTNKPNVSAILKDYMTQMDNFFAQFKQQAEEAYKNGMNDPGLVQAVNIIRDETSQMRKQLDEELNARNMGQSGIWIQAMNDFNKKVAMAEANVVGQHLSKLTENLQNSMQAILNQRIAALSQFAGIASEAELRNAELHLQSLQTAIAGLNNIAQSQFSSIEKLWGLAQSDIESQRNYDINRRQLDLQQQDINIKLRQLGLDEAKFKEAKRQFDAQLNLDWAKLNEMIRSNKANEAIEKFKTSTANINSYLDQAKLNLDTSKWQATKAGELQSYVNNLINQIEGNKISPQDVLNNADSYRKMFGVGKNGGNKEIEEAIFDNLLKYAKAKIEQQQAKNASSGSWFKNIFTPSPGYTQSTIDSILGSYYLP